MRKRAAAAATALALFLGTGQAVKAALPFCPTITSTRDLNIIIPAYVYPGTDAAQIAYWNKMIEVAATAHRNGFRLAIIVNPSNGNFTTEDANYDALIKRLDQTGALLLGYVHTTNATRPVGEVQANMRAYKSLYPEIDGFFVDETKLASDTLSYYVRLRRTAVEQFGSGVYLSGNAPGNALASSRFREVFNLTVAFEDYGRNFGSYNQQDVVAPASPSQIAYLVHSIGEIKADSAAARACKIVKASRYSNSSVRNAGWIYLTTDGASGEPPAYSSFGKEFDAFLSAVCWVNNRKACLTP